MLRESLKENEQKNDFKANNLKLSQADEVVYNLGQLEIKQV